MEFSQYILIQLKFDSIKTEKSSFSLKDQIILHIFKNSNINFLKNKFNFFEINIKAFCCLEIGVSLTSTCDLQV